MQRGSYAEIVLVEICQAEDAGKGLSVLRSGQLLAAVNTEINGLCVYEIFLVIIATIHGVTVKLYLRCEQVGIQKKFSG